MALLRAYCDASFTDAKRTPGWTSVAGYLGTEEMWTAVEKQWAENKKLWSLSEFSIAQILAGATSVGFTNAELCVRSFGRIIGKSGVEGISASIHDVDWERTYKSDRFPTKYHSCLSLLFHVIDEHVRLEFRGDAVAVVLDTDRAPDDALDALCSEWRRESKVIASITFGRRTHYPLLECADLCAGTERNAQMAGGWGTVVRETKWYATSHAHRHRGAFWSLEAQKRNEEALRKREQRRRQRAGEG
jgi:hypothetical protein